MNGQIKYLNRLKKYSFIREQGCDSEYYASLDNYEYLNPSERDFVKFEVRQSRRKNENYVEAISIKKL